ncbi:hypothetical protein [Allomuricauda sp. SCSIO 65647]|uniref:hypothetical protein n=1 Tax=Allomuricauda sp. SCSIO 65647 TaxID=2908843 RepID=UPI001F4782E7|nr:hypothetical protein [Muricauda sp. SCSIO 65647]UJH66647.1 hypothetical protein L0P89_11815 [Muricauda sp. SCSIO 65647]
MRTGFFKYTLLIVLMGLFIAPNAKAQEHDISDYRIRFNLKTIKQHDNSRILEVRFIAANKKDRKDRVPVYGAKIEFFNFLEDETVQLGSSNTSKDGIAQIALPENQSYLLDSEGKINFRAVFEGTDELGGKEREISIKDVHLNLNLIEKDSIKTVSIKAHTLDSLGVQIPLEETDVIISVEGMLSKMTIDEGVIESGEYEFEMPTDLPGDANGDVTVYTIIEDHDDYGDVVQKKTENWGVFNELPSEEKNTLWSEAAPIWMYVVLTILLLGIWANFVYTCINLYKIKKEGTALELKTENQ